MLVLAMDCTCCCAASASMLCYFEQNSRINVQIQSSWHSIVFRYQMPRMLSVLLLSCCSSVFEHQQKLGDPVMCVVNW
jgi:hypothetical protein